MGYTRTELVYCLEGASIREEDLIFKDRIQPQLYQVHRSPVHHQNQINQNHLFPSTDTIHNVMYSKNVFILKSQLEGLKDWISDLVPVRCGAFSGSRISEQDPFLTFPARKKSS
jgi:hypothetical protein